MEVIPLKQTLIYNFTLLLETFQASLTFKQSFITVSSSVIHQIVLQNWTRRATLDTGALCGWLCAQGECASLS